MRMGIGGSSLVGVLLLAAVLPDPAWAGKAARRHDGFFLRLSPGFGYASTHLDDGTDELRFSDGMGDMDIAIGGVVAKNLALHGTLRGWTMGDPDYELNNENGVIDGSLSMSAVGMGVTYYVMPVNLYLSGSLGFDINGAPGVRIFSGVLTQIDQHLPDPHSIDHNGGEVRR